jgi:hypothetical protein
LSSSEKQGIIPDYAFPGNSLINALFNPACTITGGAQVWRGTGAGHRLQDQQPF